MTNAQLYNKYYEIVDAYESKYGEGETITVDWIANKDMYGNTANDLGMAIAVGDLELINRWNGSDGSRMTVQCYSENYQGFICVAYSCPERINAYEGAKTTYNTDDI